MGGPAKLLGFHMDGQSFQSGLASLGGMAVTPVCSAGFSARACNYQLTLKGNLEKNLKNYNLGKCTQGRKNA